LILKVKIYSYFHFSYSFFEVGEAESADGEFFGRAEVISGAEGGA